MNCCTFTSVAWVTVCMMFSLYWSPIISSFINDFCSVKFQLTVLFHRFTFQCCFCFSYSSFGLMILTCMPPVSPSSPWLPRDVSGFYSDRGVTAASPADHWGVVSHRQSRTHWCVTITLLTHFTAVMSRHFHFSVVTRSKHGFLSTCPV